MSKIEPRKRRPAARPPQIIVALLEERLEMISETPDRPAIEPHIDRMVALFDELRRSLNRNKEEAETE